MRTRRRWSGTARWDEAARWDLVVPHHLLGTWLAVLAFGLLAHTVPFDPGPLHRPAVSAPALPAPPAVAAVQTTVTGTPSGSLVVALTFDDGPDPRWTPRVLDLLERHGAVATFCVVGDNAERHPDLVERILEAGHRLCHHTDDHDAALAARPRTEIERELVGLRDRLAPVTVFRAPEGRWSEALVASAAGLGMQPLGWSVDSRDWRRPGVAEIVRRVQQDVHPGAVVLLHDGGGDREQTIGALELLLPWLAAHCYTPGFASP